MWGTTARVTFPVNGATTGRVSQQLTRITYKRPETWSFMLGAKIVGGTPVGGVTQLVRVRFNVFFGVGRSVFDTKQDPGQAGIQAGFAFFTWDTGLGVQPARTPFATKYTTRVQSPPHLDSDDATREPIEWLPAQDIQVLAEVEHVRASPAQSIEMELTSYFAPRSHMRPDWMHRDARQRFLGDETEGS